MKNLPANQLNNNNGDSTSSVINKVENQVGEQVTNPVAAVLPIEIDQQEITTFESDKQVYSEHQVFEADPAFTPVSQFTDDRTHSVVSFLQRPQLLQSVQWQTSDKRHKPIGKNMIIPESLLNPMIKNKLDGFSSFRATAIIRIQVQSQPFMAGRLMLTSVPMPSLLGSRGAWILSHISRQQPLNHVEIDISKETEISLRIPFISPFNSYDLIAELWSWANVQLSVYSPLNMATAVPVDVLMWGHFEDITLGAPTGGQIGQYAPKSNRLLRLVMQQAGAPKERKNAEVKAERMKESSGIVNQIGQGAQRGWDSLGNTIPFLKPVTDIFKGLSETATNFLGPLGKIFGFSKPVVGYSANSFLSRPTQYFGTTDGVDHSHVLALVNANAVDVVNNLAGTSVDEMSFDFMKKIPIFVFSGVFSKNNKYGDVIYQSYVSPTYFIPGGDLVVKPADPPGSGSLVINSFSRYQPTNLNYICSIFEYWTGTLIYTFKFIKTDYHSGRVEISFEPFTGSIDRTDYCYRVIVDLREKTEVSVAIPYISPAPWKKVDGSYDPQNDKDWTSNQNVLCSTGKVVMKALTALNSSNAIVAGDIDVLVEISAGDDFRVSAPVKTNWMPVTLQQSGNVHATEGSSLTRTSAVEGFESASITGNDLDLKRPDMSMSCAGEVFQNFRQLIRRFGFSYKFQVQDNTYLNPVDFVRPPIALYRYGTTDVAGAKTTQFSADRYVSPLSFVGSMFAFYRGGLRFKFYTPGQTDLVGVRIDGTTAAEQDLYAASPSFMSPLGLEQPQQKKMLEFQLPYYGNCLLSCHWPHPTNLYDERPLGRLQIGYSGKNGESPLTFNAAIGAADDFDFKVFLGAPACVDRAYLKFSQVGGGINVYAFDNTNFDVDPTSRTSLNTVQLITWGDYQPVKLTDLVI